MSGVELVEYVTERRIDLGRWSREEAAERLVPVEPVEDHLLGVRDRLVGQLVDLDVGHVIELAEHARVAQVGLLDAEALDERDELEGGQAPEQDERVDTLLAEQIEEPLGRLGAVSDRFVHENDLPLLATQGDLFMLCQDLLDRVVGLLGSLLNGRMLSRVHPDHSGGPGQLEKEIERDVGVGHESRDSS